MNAAPNDARLLCVDKPAGMTSFDVVGRVRRITGRRRVGHGGTLDPFATGVLVVGLGAATRLLRYLAEGSKTYEAIVRFGAETDTDDRTGEVKSRASSVPSAAGLEAILPSFTGWIEQVPPRFSAIHVGGERSYRKARRGEEHELAPRRVRIDRLELLALEGGSARLRVDCGGGTYIRALARDLGRALDSRAHLQELRRTRVGGFGLDVAVDLDSLERRWAEGERFFAPAELVGDWEHCRLDDDRVRGVRQGRQPEPDWFGAVDWEGVADRVALLDAGDALVATAEREQGGALRLAVVLPEDG